MSWKRNPDKNRKNRQDFFDRMYPDVPRQGVYIIKDETQQIVYVGESNNLPRRLAEHIGGYDVKKSFHKGQLESNFVKEFYQYDIIETSDLYTRLRTELDYEFEHKPKYNIRWRKK